MSRRSAQPIALADSLVQVLIIVSLGGNTLLVACMAVVLGVWPAAQHAGIAEAGDIWGWLAFGLTVAAASLYQFRARRPVVGGSNTAAMLCLFAMLAFFFERWDAGNWLSYHTLMIGCAITAATQLALGCWQTSLVMFAAKSNDPHVAETAADDAQPRLRRGFDTAAARDVVASALLAFVLAMRAAVADPGWPWWTVGVLLAIAWIGVGLSTLTYRRSYLYASAGLINLAVSICAVFTKVASSTTTLVDINVIALAVPAVAWLWLELRSAATT